MGVPRVAVTKTAWLETQLNAAYSTFSKVLEESSTLLMFGMHEALQTPGATCQRLSIGLIPTTLRQPKRGEMLLSVLGSPLGEYMEDNMEAINESDKG